MSQLARRLHGIMRRELDGSFNLRFLRNSGTESAPQSHEAPHMCCIYFCNSHALSQCPWQVAAVTWASCVELFNSTSAGPHFVSV